MPLRIGHGQTISQPYMVAVICQAAEVGDGDSTLDIGTGSGYQAAVLAALGAEVHTIERIPELAERARARLARAGYEAWTSMSVTGRSASRSMRRTTRSSSRRPRRPCPSRYTISFVSAAGLSCPSADRRGSASR